MPYQKLSHRSDRLRNSRLLLDIARIFNESIYGMRALGAGLDGVFIVSCVAIGHAENKLMNISKLSYYLGMSRQTVTRRLEELIRLGIIERTGQYFYIAAERAEQVDHMMRTNNLIVAACRDIQQKSTATPKMGTSVFRNAQNGHRR